MCDEPCEHQVDGTGHCLEPTCKNYAFYAGEEQRQAIISIYQRQRQKKDE